MNLGIETVASYEDISIILLQPAYDREILYFATGLSDQPLTDYFNSDWCTELQFARSLLDPKHFALVDKFGWDHKLNYRILFLLESILSQCENDNEILARAINGKGFDALAGSTVAEILRNPLFNATVEELNEKYKISVKGERANIHNLIDALDDFYKRDHNKDIIKAIAGQHDENQWFVWSRECTGPDIVDASAVIIKLMLRHKSGGHPEIVITIEHSVTMVQELAQDFNCDSYVER